MDLSGKVALVTGSARGIGREIALKLAEVGATVVVSDVADAEPVAEEIRAMNRQSLAILANVSSSSDVAKLVETTISNYGRVDILVNNAGCGLGGFFEDLTEEEIRHSMETNFFGVQAVTREVIPLMRQRKQGKIINISSVSGFSTSPAFGAYNASKWALEGFSESLRYELKFFGIDVLLIEPGTYKTKIFTENARYASNFDNPQSPYYLISQFLRKRVENHFKDCHKDIEEVPELIEKLIKSSNPSFRNIPDIESQMLYILRKILPFRVYSFLLRKVLFSGLKQ